MFGYNFELAWRGLKHNPRTTLLVVLTMALGLASAMTTMTLLHVLSADPLPGVSQHLYMSWVDSRQAPKAGESDGGSGHAPPWQLKLADAQALLAHRATPQVMLTEILQNVTNESGEKSQGSQFGIAASNGLFRLFGIPLLHGRSWTAAEAAARTPVVVISGELSQKLFGDEDSVGQSVRVGGKPFRVIGVSGKWAPQPHFYGLNTRAFGGPGENIFMPVGALMGAGLAPLLPGACDRDTPLVIGKIDTQHCRWLSVWAQLDTSAQMAAYRQFLTDYAHDQHAAGRFERPPHAELYSTSRWLSLNNVVPDNVRLNVWLAGGFLLLCMVNVAGLLAARFLRRSGEIGVRRALGAPRQAIFVQCVWEAGMAGLVGGVLALPLTWFGLWVVRRQGLDYTGLAHMDPLTFSGMFALALGVGVLVGMLPAWRACCVEPGLQVRSI